MPAEVAPAPALVDGEGRKWLVHVGACLVRYPRITPDPTKEELQYAAVREKIDLEKSCLSMDELKEEEERKRRAKNPDADDDDPSKFAQYREEFLPSDRVTPEDRRNERRSLNRHLQHTLVLLVKGKEGWELPTTPLGVGETLRAALERVVVRTVGGGAHTHTVGNCPSGCLVLPATKTDAPGLKTFFLRALYVDGSITLHKDFKDHVWVPLAEMPEYLKGDYFQAVRPFAY